MDAYSKGALIKKFQSKGGRLFERGGNSRVCANSSIYGIKMLHTLKRLDFHLTRLTGVLTYAKHGLIPRFEELRKTGCI